MPRPNVTDRPAQSRAPGLEGLSETSEMSRRIRAFDWSKTSLGPVEQWPQSLKTAVRILLGSRYPMFVWWGKEVVNIYNDAYAPMLGHRHPRALGQSARETWSDIWEIVGAQADLVIKQGQSTWNEETLLMMTRYGYLEETYFTFSYSPAPDDNGAVAGVFCAVSEETQKVISRRRMRTLRELAAKTLSAQAAEEACVLAAQTLAENPHELPFALLYLLAPDGKTARLAGASGLKPGLAASPSEIALELASPESGQWPVAELLRTGRSVPVLDLAARFGALPGGPWAEPTRAAMLLPLSPPGQAQLSGFLIAGVSPVRPLDEEYRGFLGLVAGQVSTAIANVQAYEAARKRAEALAELDRAKTAFFSNVSHEFRTPLTLMLGPVEELLASRDGGLTQKDKGQLELVNRNGLRLLRLVNTLLDFSRIEAGRVQAVFEPTDLCAFTAELSSVFRAATDRAGLALRVDCASLPEPVYVDRDMWEKVVLNLLSNAFKFTFEGEIEVSLRAVEDCAELRVRDTGVGIPAEAMPRLFERFHRVPSTRSRTHEGSGIGLALVQELIKLHGGTVRAESQPGVGTTFVVRIPLGRAHLPAEQLGARRQLASSAVGAAPFVEEALRWLPDAESLPELVASLSPPEGLPALFPPLDTGRARPRLLLADDNADMRQYLARLLGERYEVQAVDDGAAALAAAREHRPDLILSDVMMPRLDGLGLVQALRADAVLQTVPIILLSARAGEESRVEGLQHGADDYLIKPFSARELLARVAAHLELARLRKESEEALRQRTAQFETLLNRAPLGVYLVDADFRLRQVNPVAAPVFGPNPDQMIGRDFDEIMHSFWERPRADEVVRRFRHTLATGESFEVPDWAEFRVDRGLTEYYDWRIHRILLPDGRYGVVCYFQDITERKSHEVALREAVARYERQARLFEGVASTTPDFVYVFDVEGRFLYANRRLLEVWGMKLPEIVGKTCRELGYEQWHHDMHMREIAQVIQTKLPLKGEVPFKAPLTGTFGIYEYIFTPVITPEGEVELIAGTTRDITERKQAQEAMARTKEELERLVTERTAKLQEMVAELEHFSYTITHDMRAPLRAMRGFAEALKELAAAGEYDQQQPFLERIMTGAARMDALIIDALNYSRAVRQELTLSPVDTGKLLRGMLESYPGLQPAHAQIRLEGELPVVLGNEAGLTQCFSNLLGNAVKFAKPGQRAEVRVWAERRSGWVRLWVEDRGVGIPGSMLPRVFDMFSRGQNSQAGTGIGLALVRKVVDRMGGKVGVESEVGQGSRFWLELKEVDGSSVTGDA